MNFKLLHRSSVEKFRHRRSRSSLMIEQWGWIDTVTVWPVYSTLTMSDVLNEWSFIESKSVQWHIVRSDDRDGLRLHNFTVERLRVCIIVYACESRYEKWMKTLCLFNLLPLPWKMVENWGQHARSIRHDTDHDAYYKLVYFIASISRFTHFAQTNATIH